MILEIMEIKCGKNGFLSLSIYESQIGMLISIIIAILLAFTSGTQFCLNRRNIQFDSGKEIMTNC